MSAPGEVGFRNCPWVSIEKEHGPLAEGTYASLSLKEAFFAAPGLRLLQGLV